MTNNSNWPPISSRRGKSPAWSFRISYTEIRSGLEETSLILNGTATAMAQKDSEYQKALAEQYAAAEPVSGGRSGSAAAGKGRGRPARKPVGDQSNVTAQASQWKTSREELENTRQDVNARMDSYEETVNNLLG